MLCFQVRHVFQSFDGQVVTPVDPPEVPPVDPPEVPPVDPPVVPPVVPPAALVVVIVVDPPVVPPVDPPVVPLVDPPEMVALHLSDPIPLGTVHVLQVKGQLSSAFIIGANFVHQGVAWPA